MQSSDQITAKELMARIAVGDRAAFAQVYNAYAEMIFNAAALLTQERQLAEDAVHFVMLKVWERAPDLAKMDNPIGWMHNTAKFHIINTFKKQIADRRYQANTPEAVPQEDPAELLLKKQRQAVLNGAIADLPARQQEVYRMSREEGYTYSEIAGLLDLKHETVKEHMARALKSIKAVLNKHRDLFISLLVGTGYFFWEACPPICLILL